MNNSRITTRELIKTRGFDMKYTALIVCSTETTCIVTRKQFEILEFRTLQSAETVPYNQTYRTGTVEEHHHELFEGKQQTLPK